jgi:protein-tyrosine phosphatase
LSQARLLQLAPQWRSGLLALLVLGPFFFWSYGAANHWAASRAGVPSIVFDWEAAIPLWPWTILPYWSIDLFYGLSLLLARDALELRRQAARLLTAQLLCVVCFVLWPLKFSTPRPAVDGWAGWLFNALAGFDLPYNQAPSLHIVLLLILWDFYRQRLQGWAAWGLHAWSALIGVSVLTTYQHHFIDVPAGLLAGSVCMWLWPLSGALPWQAWRQEGARHPLALAWGGLAVVCALAALGWGNGWSRLAWVLIWPAISFALVALAYLGLGQGVFQKDTQGRHTVGSALLLAPHRWVAWLNARCWTWRLPTSVEVADGVWLGRLPLLWERDHRRFAQILDVTAELRSSHPGLQVWPMLDLVVPQPAQLRLAADHLAVMHARGEVLVSCALGFSRSAAVVLVWLCRSGRAVDVDAAVAHLRLVRPQVVLSPALLAAAQAAVVSR